MKNKTKSKITRGLKDIFLEFFVIIIVEALLCYLFKTKMFDNLFFLFIVSFFISSVICKIILRKDDTNERITH